MFPLERSRCDAALPSGPGSGSVGSSAARRRAPFARRRLCARRDSLRRIALPSARCHWRSILAELLPRSIAEGNAALQAACSTHHLLGKVTDPILFAICNYSFPLTACVCLLQHCIHIGSSAARKRHSRGRNRPRGAPIAPSRDYEKIYTVFANDHALRLHKR